MNVLIVTATNQRRGAEIQALALTAELRDAGVKVEHVALMSRDSDGPALEIEILGTTWKSVRTLFRLRRKSRYVDVVIAFGSVTLPACAISLAGTRTPFIFRSIGDPHQWLRGSVHRWRTALLVRRASRLAALWNGEAKSLSELYGVSPAHIAIVPNARSADQHSLVSEEERSAARERFGVRVDDSVITLVGSLTEEKCIDRAIETIALNRSLRLMIAGDGPLREELEAMARDRAPGRAHFLGSVENVSEVYAAADVVLITSRTEGIPGVAIEAGLRGISVVSTDVGGVSTVVRQGVTGLVVTSADPAAILEAIQVVLDKDIVLRQDIRNHCLSNFTWSRVTPLWLELIESVIDDGTRLGRVLGSRNSKMSSREGAVRFGR